MEGKLREDVYMTLSNLNGNGGGLFIIDIGKNNKNIILIKTKTEKSRPRLPK